jgi:isopentenyl-diphosphate delta-isomerase
MDYQKVILINQQDQVLGEMDKLRAHQGNGALHRAFTILVFNSQGQVLLQKRAASKFLWPLIWETSCSSHQQLNEDDTIAAQKRLRLEMGIECQLDYLTNFYYHAPWPQANGAEHEICYIFVGHYDGLIKPNELEVADYQWLGAEELQEKIKNQPQDYAPWLVEALDIYKLTATE